MIQAKCQIVEKKQIGKKFFIVVFENAVIASKAKPGQFVHINLGPGSVLRRPFSIYDTYRDTFSILFQVVGAGTNRLATYRSSQFLDIIGPLGHGFPQEGKKPVLVAGGLGIAVLNLLNRQFLNNDIEPEVLLGFRDSTCVIDFSGAQVCTEDGSFGQKGLVTDMLKQTLKEGADVIYACGPEAMLKEVSLIASKFKVKTYVSMERFMGCGVGACLSCVCETKFGLARVCREGPVFDSQDIIWGNEEGEKKAKGKT